MSVQALPSETDCDGMTERLLELVTGANADVKVYGTAKSSTAFARGETHVASNLLQVTVDLGVEIDGRWASGTTNQLDDAGLKKLAAEVQFLAKENPSIWPERVMDLPQTYPEGPQIYFESTAEAMQAEPQAAFVQRALAAAEEAKLVAAGDIEIETVVRAVRTTAGRFVYERSSYGEISMTARDAVTNASGWAWSGFEDWKRVDAPAVIARTIDLAKRSANPVAIEPGRYTVILEPAAVAALMERLLLWWPAGLADAGITPYAKDPMGTNKIGLQMIDRRLGMIAGPNDPDRPSSTKTYGWQPIEPVVWFEHGVLKNLEYDAGYAKSRGRKVLTDPTGVRLTADGAPTSLEDMIASVKRGLWVSRFSHVGDMNVRTGLMSGTTRDGTFLIENGKVTKAIKNLRFTESPFFIFNKVEAWGVAERASRNTVMPRMMVRDFDFTSLTDAI